MTLDQAPLLQSFSISHLDFSHLPDSKSLAASHQEQIRQLEAIGFLPEEPVMLLNKGLIKGDAMIVRVGVSTFALRPQEASMVVLQKTVESPSHA